jgi:hypothetical protein
MFRLVANPFTVNPVARSRQERAYRGNLAGRARGPLEKPVKNGPELKDRRRMQPVCVSVIVWLLGTIRPTAALEA